MNNIREKKFFEAKAKGYKLASYISKNAIVNSKLGENCLVADGVIINPFSKIGSNNFFWEFFSISDKYLVYLLKLKLLFSINYLNVMFKD